MSREHDLTLRTNELVGMITISRPTESSGDEYVNIAISDELSGSEFVDLRISLPNFAKALTGQGYIPCVFEHRPAVVGMKSENKTELVPWPNENAGWSDKAKPLLRAEAAKFEVDGWKARESDLTNHHCHVAKNGKSYQKVVFFRHVKVQP